ncbi:MAG: glycoside hydrolase family 3 C-terminal domain-containing protein, partial [Chloroflexota bacterium]
QSVNAGIDMNMVPYDYVTFISALDEAVENGDITLERIDEAVGNILRVKFELGLFEMPYGDPDLQALIGSDDHRAVARQAVSESLVLLKNENNALPLDATAEQTVFITGSAADNIGIQSGGWTIEWQGLTASVTPGISIRRGLQRALGDDVSLRYSYTGRFTDDEGNPARGDVGIVVVGEEPYAEWFGDDASLTLTSRDRDLVENMREQVDTLIVVLISGRPMVIDEQLNLADAFVAAWLPGTEGDGIADVLVGDQDFVGTLPFTWVRSVEQLPYDFDNIPMDGCEAPLFPRGYGLTYESVADDSADWLDLSVECAPEPVITETVDVVIPDADLLAPEGEYGIEYVAPFPVAITLDGEFEDWAGVPLMTMPRGASPDQEPSATFGATADDTHLYFYANVIDSTVITGEHGTNFWNEDSIEFYINGTGDLTLSSYQDGVAQITVPPLNMFMPDELTLAGVNQSSTGSDAIVVQTEMGWAVEVSVPLENDVWTIEPTQDGILGFQVHLNAASNSDRDTKLIWSAADTSDLSYQNPSLFGQMRFHDIGATNTDSTDEASADEATTDEATVDDTEVVGNLLEDGAGREWELVWSDEFDGDGIDPTRWSYDTGGSGFGNNELQYYTDNEENSYVEDGNLVIVAREERVSVRDYTSAKLWTLGHFSMQYGRIDIRARMPQGQGFWPAFWMLPTRYAYGGWPASGEIDIMELIGHEPATVHGTLHYTGSEFGTHVYTGDSFTLDEGTFADDFHVFSIVWEEDRFEWYVDGELYQVQTEWQTADQAYPAPFDQEFFLIINLAVGGEWPGSPDETTEFPQTLEVDYVRVYQASE